MNSKLNYEIKPLPQSVISKLRSGVNVSSVAQCVEELVLNSVDAKASCVAVRLDLPYRKIQVVDNGIGIEKHQFDFIGERYHTSKCHNLNDMSNLGHYGFRGEALASLIEMSGVFEIESRFKRSEETYDKIFLLKAKKKPRVTKKDVKRPSVGTTITILDFMHNLPVRKSLICPVRDLEKSRERIQAIALMHPEISFSLRNDSTGELCLEIKKCKDLSGTFRTLFGYQKGQSAKVIRYNRGQFSVDGLISVDGHYSKDLQFLYINKRLVLKTRLHTSVNYIIGKRLLGRSNHRSSTSTQSPKKDKNPIFILNITCPLNIYDVTFEPSKTLVEFQNWELVLNIFEGVLKNFVKEHFGEDLEEEVAENLPNLDRDDNEAISTTNVKNSMHSLPAVRKPKDLNRDEPQPLGQENPSTNPDQSSENFVTPICRKRFKTPSPVITQKSVTAFTCSLAEFAKRFRSEPKLGTGWKLPDPTPKIERVAPNDSVARNTSCEVSKLNLRKMGKVRKKVQFNLDLNEVIQAHVPENYSESPESTNTEPFTVSNPILNNSNPLSERINENNDQLPGSEPFCITQPFEIESSSIETPRELISNSKFEFQSIESDDTTDSALDQNYQSRYFDKTTKSTCASFMKKCKNSTLFLSSQTIPMTYLPYTPKGTRLNYVSDSKSSSTISSLCYSPIANTTSETKNQMNQSSEEEMETNYNIGTKSSSSESSECLKRAFPVTRPWSKERYWIAEVKSKNQMDSSSEELSSTEMEQEENVMAKLSSSEMEPEENVTARSSSSETELENNVKNASSEISKNSQSLLASLSKDGRLFETKNQPNPYQIEPNQTGGTKFGLESRNEKNQSLEESRNEKNQSLEESRNQKNQSLEESRNQMNQSLEEIKNQNNQSLEESRNQTNQSFQESRNQESQSLEASRNQKNQSLEASRNQTSQSLEERFSSQKKELLKVITGSKSSFSQDFFRNSIPVEIEENLTEDVNNSKDSSDSLGNWIDQWQSLGDKFNSLFEKMEKSSSSPKKAESELTKVQNKECIENNQIAENDSYCWKTYQDPKTGSTMYINRKTGNSSFKVPEKRKDTLSETDLKKPKHYFLSHDSSPFQPRMDRNEHHRDKETASEVSNVLKDWENPVFERNDSKDINDIWELSTSDALVKAHHSLYKYKLNKNMLKNVKVINQIDDKFIVCLMNNDDNEKLLVLFDQHAVHERIRLEHLTNDLCIGNITKYADIIPPLVLNLEGEWVRLARAYRDELKKLGVNLLFNCTDVDHVSVCTAPTCFVERESNSLKRGRSTTLENNLTDLIKEQLTRIRDKTMGPSLPVTLQNILNSQACRGAIKFGDKLNTDECQELISNLSDCNLPFQCAHGRPSLVPLVNFSNLKDFFTVKIRPKYENLRKKI